ncbi:hypothetical protein ABDJ41_10215 [Pedobacter sp. ASV1-7]|uniref:hypothetical protein n=1 Tax=Pedobacter sp. ASV1-7 TaxID=3145237 RepID=UPI0032E8F08D
MRDFIGKKKMRHYSVTKNQKRFLIIWCLIHSFALFVNLANIEGAVDFSKTEHYYEPSYFLSRENKPEQFWPFVTFYDKTFSNFTGKWEGTFYGIFTAYGFEEFVFYILLGFAIIFIPKLWRN